MWQAMKRIDARADLREALVARADEQHRQLMAGDDRGLYGIYEPSLVSETLPWPMDFHPSFRTGRRPSREAH